METRKKYSIEYTVHTSPNTMQKAGVPLDALAPYPWSRSFDWCPAEANETQIIALCGFMRIGRVFTFYQKQ